jgi:hypothetical protein
MKQIVTLPVGGIPQNAQYRFRSRGRALSKMWERIRGDEHYSEPTSYSVDTDDEADIESITVKIYSDELDFPTFDTDL